jgi:hypothetical protein
MTDPDVNLSIHPARATLKKVVVHQDKEFLRNEIFHLSTIQQSCPKSAPIASGGFLGVTLHFRFPEQRPDFWRRRAIRSSHFHFFVAVSSARFPPY